MFSDTPLDIKTNFTAVVEEAAGAQSYGIIAYVILGSLGLAIVVLDIITFPRQIGFFKVCVMNTYSGYNPEMT